MPPIAQSRYWNPTRPRAALRGRRRCFPRLELLEDRVVPAFLYRSTVERVIPDNQTVTSPIQVPNAFAVGQVRVEMNIRMTANTDLDVFLIGPNGARVELFTDVGGAGSNFFGTVLDDQAATSIASVDASSPYTGKFRPEGHLADFVGRQAQGTWRLEISDDDVNDQATLLSWSLEFGPGDVPPAIAPEPFVEPEPGEYRSLDVPRAVPATGTSGTTTSTLTVPDVGFVTDVDVRLTLAHRYDADLDVFLVGPDGTRVELFSDVGRSNANFVGTVLDDEASSNITAASAPFTGTFRPEGALARFDGKPAQGLWRLEINDDDVGDVGTLLSWALFFEVSISPPPAPPEARGVFSSQDVPKAVPPVGSLTTLSTLTVPTAGIVQDVNVFLSLTHTWAEDVDVYLVSPDGARVELFTTVGGDNDNFLDTVLNDDAATSIINGSVPFTGKFRPEGRLDAFIGRQVQGVWTLEITDDDLVTYTGTLLSWALDFGPADVPPEPERNPDAGEYRSQDVPKAIPDAGTIVSTLTVPAAGFVSDVNVRLRLTHANDADLDVFLVGPDGSRAQLFTDVGGSGDHFLDTIFDDEAATAITSGNAPFTGIFRPEGQLGRFDFRPAQGVWRLEVSDDEGADVGELISWSLILGLTDALPSFATGVFASEDVPKPVPPSRTVERATSTLTIATPGLIEDVNVSLNLVHTWNDDLDVFLVGPDGTRVELFTDVGSSNDNFTGTRLDDEASTSITAGTSPFAGKFRPEGRLSDFIGKQAQGVWTLEITDDFLEADNGTLVAWSLDFGPQGGPPEVPEEPPREADPGEFRSDHVPLDVDDLTTIVSTLTVADERFVTDVDVRLRLAHSFPSDLDVFLVGPDGTRVELFTDVGGVGPGFLDTILDDEAPAAIASAASPFTGRFRPEGRLSKFDRKRAQGEWRLEVTDDDGMDVGRLISWSIVLGLADTLPPVIRGAYASRDVPKAVPASRNEGTITSTLTVADAGDIEDVNVTLTLTHSSTSELEVFLVGPDGTRVELFTNVGFGRNFIGTRLDDQATTSVTSGNSPFTGKFRPEGRLEDFLGKQAQGVWILEVKDDFLFASDGTLVSWSLDFTPSDSPPEVPEEPPREADPGEFRSDHVPVFVGDLGVIVSTLIVPDSGFITDVDVRLRLAHSFAADLDVFLIAPDGTRVELFTDVGGAGPGFLDTILDDEAPAAIASAASPFTGRFRPERRLGNFDRKRAQGEWRLEVTDDDGADVGRLISWSIVLGLVDPLPPLPPLARGVHASDDVPKSIPPPGATGATTSTLIVENQGLIQDVNVTLSLQHTWDADLTVVLESPGGIRVQLFSGIGDSDDNFFSTVLNDEANASITFGSAPFTGKFQPQGKLSDFDNSLAIGVWTLEITDVFPSADDGMVLSWSLDFGSDAVTPSIPKEDPRASDPGEYRNFDLPRQVPAVGTKGTIVSTVYVSAPGFVTDVDVRLTLAHTYYAELTVFLVGPDGTRVLLFQGVGGPGENSFDAVLDDEATDNIAEAFPAFQSTYTPMEGLGKFDRRQAQGVWQLVVMDTGDLDVGTLGSWSLVLGTNSTPVTGVFRSKQTQPVLDSAPTRPVTTTSRLLVTDPGVIEAVKVSLILTHTRDSDLVVSLVSPIGIRVLLFSRVGREGDNFFNTVLDANAVASIARSSAPFRGSYKPQGSLSTLIGLSALGEWTLEIIDVAPGNMGTLVTWSLVFGNTGGNEDGSAEGTGLGIEEVDSIPLPVANAGSAAGSVSSAAVGLSVVALSGVGPAVFLVGGGDKESITPFTPNAPTDKTHGGYAASVPTNALDILAIDGRVNPSDIALLDASPQRAGLRLTLVPLDDTGAYAPTLTNPLAGGDDPQDDPRGAGGQRVSAGWMLAGPARPLGADDRGSDTSAATPETRLPVWPSPRTGAPYSPQDLTDQAQRRFLMGLDEWFKEFGQPVPPAPATPLSEEKKEPSTPRADARPHQHGAGVALLAWAALEWARRPLSRRRPAARSLGVHSGRR